MSSGKIHVLSDLLMKRIAAGEVVERPASVAKELLENSLDAGAKAITIHIKNGGIDWLQVVDDGCGMGLDDALLCCHRHATSKIATTEDLEAIETLGFRGEALASISAVARMELVTAQEGDADSTRLLIEDGVVKEQLKAAPRTGTSITVRDLFYNVPARRKFLKTPSTELRHLMAVFRRVAIAYPEVAFTLWVEEQKTFDLRAGSRQKRIADLTGDSRSAQLIPVKKEISGVTVEGLVSRPGAGGRSRDNQMFFLNRRYITSRSLMHALLSAYGPTLMRDEHPSFFLFLEIDPSRVDVNVHPTKIEVRFLDERLIHDTVRRAVSEAMRKPAVVPDLQLITGRPRPVPRAEFQRTDIEDLGQLTLEVQRPGTVGNLQTVSEFRSMERQRPPFWQLHNTYILTQIKSSLTLIDQHVAHERILYEKALKSQANHAGMSQQLLFPQTVHLRPEDRLALEQMIAHLTQIGFVIKDFGQNSVLIEAVPVTVKNGTEKELLLSMLEGFREEGMEIQNPFETVAKVFSCKAAIKAGDPLTLQEMASLVDQLFTTDEPYFCPHGRPIVVNISLDEINKRFGR